MTRTTRSILRPLAVVLGTLAALAGAGVVRGATAEATFLSRVEAATKARRDALRQVEADVVVHVDAPLWAGAGTCEGRLVARRPGALRLRGYAAVATVFDAVTDGRRFAVHLPGQNLLWVGPAGKESELVGLPVDPGTIVGAIFGEPWGAHGRPRALAGAADWVAYDQADGAEVRARWGGAPLRIEEAELWADGGRVARLVYHDWRKRKGVWWPTRIDFDGGPDRGSLALEFTEVRFDHVPPDAAFAPPVAPEATVVDLGALLAPAAGGGTP
jgi:hypothetical protein